MMPCDTCGVNPMSSIFPSIRGMVALVEQMNYLDNGGGYPKIILTTLINQVGRTT